MVGVQDVEAAQGEVMEQLPKDWRERLVGDFFGRQERDVFVSKLFRGWRPVFGFSGTKLLLERGIWRVNQQSVVATFSFGFADFSVHVCQTQWVLFLDRLFLRWFVSGQPAGVGFQRDRRFGKKPVAGVMGGC